MKYNNTIFINFCIIETNVEFLVQQSNIDCYVGITDWYTNK